MEIDAIVDSWRYVQETNRKKRPQSLTQFVIDNGGLVDYAGEVRHIAGSAQERPGLISRNGQDLDDMALRAWESGFLPGDRPTVAAFLDVLDDDLMHGNIVREQDLAALEDFKYADEIAQELADYGVNISRFRSEASLREYFGQERQKPARQVEAGEEAQAAAEVGEGEGGSTAVEDAPYELAQKPEDFDNYVKTGAKPSKSDAKDLGDSPGITTEASGQTSLVPEPTTKDKIAAQTKAKEKKGGNEPMDEGLFGSSKDQLDLVDMAKQPEKETGKVETKADKAETKTNETETKPEADNLPDALRDRLLGEGFATIIEARKFAKDYGFEGSTKDVDELVEQAVVAAAKQIVSETGDVKAAYQAIVDLYNKQPNLAVRTSTSVTNQAYSTPAPLAYLASRLADVANASHVLEPTAGNGMLLIEADPNAVEANEIDPKRAKALRDQNFATVKSVDATDPAFTQAKSADSVIMNPPFGAVREDGQSKSWTVDGLETSAIDHAIALNALHAMTDDGKAVIIMGGVNAESIEERRKGYRGKSKRLFFAKLYKTYNVTDHFTVSGDLYKKQGAGWPVDVVVIEGRGQSERPLPASEPPVILKTWDDLKGKLPDVGTSTKPIRGSQQATDADNRPAGGTDLGKRGSESGDGSGRPNAVGSGTERLPAGTEDKPAGVRADRDRGQPADVSKGVGTEPDSAAQSVRDRRTANERPAPRRERLERTAPPEGSGQALYEPSSSAASLDTLIPVNMAQATKSALSRVEDKHGSLDAFVAEQLGYTDDLSKYFSAEQVDAIAAAIDNIERGSGYILGDQCVGGETLIFDPITGDHTPIQVLTERGEPISVLSLTNDGFAARSATSPFLKGVADLYRVTFDDGSSITVTRGHRFLTSNGWASLDAGVEVGTEIASFSSTNNTAYRRVVAIQFDRHDAFFDMHVPGAFNYVANGVVNHNTGIGKGRVVAATIRYAIRKGWTPVFVTEKPDLYGDMFRDMADIGLRKMLGHEPRALMTNTGESVPLDEEALAWKQEADQARADGQPIPKRRGRFLTAGGKPAQEKAMQAMASGKGQHDIVFTTYDQMNTIKKQETDRRRFLRQIMPNSLLILDESHNAGGQGEKRFKAKHGDAPDRAEYVRGLVKDAAGVVYSSATFAKRPDVMDLYARTDMGKAVDDPKMLPALIQKGGVPMQQIVASMLSNAGQYMRRERSFEGVEYAVEPVPVDEKTYKQFSDAVRAVFEFDLAVEDIRDKVMEDILDKMGATKAKDAGVGGGSANSIAFAAIMHNIVNQMLLSIKARQVAQRAIDAHKAGEKPVIALAGTMESFISDYAEDAGISIGQPIAISFGDVLQRYLSRTLRITVKDSDNQKKHVQIPISDLPPSLQRKYAEAEQLIKEGDFDSMPVSPIDAIRHELTSAGLSVAEVTGRKVMIDYGAKGNSAVLIDRPKSEIGPSGKRSSIAAFNRGGLDALILNRSGSTGVSMHASKAFKDQSPRRMIIAQAEANIDTHCLDAKTEILTPDGFKGIDDAFDTVAAIDPVSGAVAWRPVTGRVKRALGADETMFGIQSPGLDIRVTNNHRMLMKHRRQSVGWRFETAEDIGRRRSNWRLPVSGVQIPEKSLNLTDHELRFIGWVLTDGSINYKSRQIVIWQAEHQPYHDDIRACIEGCGFKYGVTENRGKTQHVRNSRSIGYVISLGQWRHLKEYLDKDFPIAFEHLDRRQLSVLLEALHLGDGTKFNNQPWTRRSYHIASGRKTFADRLQSLCIRRGYRCNVSEMNYNLNPLYMVRIKDKNEQSVGGPTQDDGRPTFGPVSFDAGETVWCVENELGTLITRRNGKVAFVGNCQMLGRVHRTGQVRTPSYTQIAAEIPAEARPTAVLMKKMASLNANTTGARGSVFMADSIDFMNDVGDKVVANIIQDEPEINAKLGNPLKENVKGLPVSEDAARRVTGRLVLLTPKEQTELLNRIQDEYKAEIERLDALGENALEAKTVDLKARHIETTALKDRTGEGPFLDSAQIEKVSIKSQGRAMAPKEVAEKISEALEITTPEGEGAAQLAVLERSGREWMNKKIGDVRSRSQSWIASDVASKSDDAKVTTKKRHDDQLARWIQTAQVVAPGARVTLQLGDRQMHAIVLSVARTGKAKNPVALGAWTATMAVPDSVRTLTLPFSQLFPPSQVKGSEESGAEVRFSQVPFTGLISQLEDARREDREDRYIVTGNILAGYEQVRGKGRIVNFTMKDGSLRPGVLMGRDFELDKFLERRAVRFRSADQVVTFMTRAPGAQVRSIDKFVTLSRTGSGWQIDMPSGRATGGRYFTDKRVRDAISPDDFSRVGGVMGVRLYDVQKFKAAVEAMLKIGAMFETTEDQEIAQEVIRDGKPPMPKSEPVQSGKAQSETARAISDFAKGVADLKQRTGVQTRQRGDNEPLAAVTGRALEKLTTPSMKAEVAKTQGVSAAYRADGMFFSQSEVGGAVDLRDQIEKAVAAGESFDVPHWHVQDQMEAIRPNLHMFPAGTITGVLHRIDPIDAENVKLHFRTPDGKNKTMGYPLKEIGQSRALALPSRFLGRPIFFAINITIGKQTANAVSGEVWHEAFHILRREGYIRGDRWARLLRHAKKLRVFDMAFRDVLGKIKDPTAQWAPDGITLRQVYAKLYHGRDDHVEVMHQEEITHMIELWHHGALTDADVAPVMDILNDMGSGKIAGNQTTSQTDMDRILFGEGYFAAQQAPSDQDELGYYSALLRAAYNLRQEKGTPEQMLAMLQKEGARKAEIEATNLAQLFEGKPSITKSEIIKYLQDNRIEVRESGYEPPQGKIVVPDTLSGPARRFLERIEDDFRDDGIDRLVLRDALAAERDRYFYSDEAAPAWIDEISTAMDRGDVTVAGAAAGYNPVTKWSSYSLDPSNPTYRETVLHLPYRYDALNKFHAEMKAKYGKELFDEMPLTADEGRRLLEINDKISQMSEFKSGHFPEPNIIGHLMTSMTKHEGKPVYTIDQIQSDWSQNIRDSIRNAYAKDMFNSDWDSLSAGQKAEASKAIAADQKAGTLKGGVRDEAKMAQLQELVRQAERNVEDQRARGAIAAGPAVDLIKEVNPKSNISPDDGPQIVHETLRRYTKTNPEIAGRAAPMLDELAKFDLPKAHQDLTLRRAELRTAQAATPGHPLVNTTDQWTNTTLRRAIRQAVEAGAEYIAIPHGDTVASYNPQGDLEGNAKFYGSRTIEGIVPKNLRKLLQKIDRDSPAPQRVEKLETTRGEEGWQTDSRNDFDENQTGFTLFQITDKVRQSVLSHGQPLFAASGPAASIGQWLDWAENLGDKQIQIKDRNGKAYTIERVGRFGSITYTVMDGRKTVGSFYVRTGGAVPGTISVMNALIERGYQRRGLASAVYDAIEADTAAGGRPLYPQGRYSLSEDGRAFWQARDPAKLAEMDRVDSEPGYAYGQAVRVALDRPAQTKLKTEISEAIAIVQRIAGNGVHIDFKSQIPARAARQAVADVEAFRAAGRAGDFIGGFYRPETAHIEALIGLSVEAPGFDLRTAAGHEAWHHVERVFATDAELRVLYSPAEQARMRKLVAVELGLDPDNSRRDAALLAVMPQVEVTAYAFQRYRRLREEGMASMNGLHIAVRRLFERVYKIFQNIKGVVTSEGLTYETIFETARTGAMAKRQRRDRRSHGRVAASGVGNLDMSPEARKARAEEMGFDTSKVWYHSSLSPIEAFEPHGKFMGRWGVSGISLTNNPKMASRYLDRYGDVNYKGVPFQKNVMPLYVKRGLRIKEITTPIKQKLGLGFPLPEGYKWPKELDGYDGILVRDAINGQDVVEGSDAALLRDLELDDFEGKVFHTDETDPGAIAGYELILRDPSNIRSVNAAFDPALYDSASLLAQSLPSIEAIIQSVVDKAANTNTNIATHAALFVDQYLTFDEGQSTTSGEMYDAYKIWAKNANVEAGDEQAFHRAMISHGGMSRMRIAGRTRYLGVRIASKLGRKVADANALMPVEKRTLAQDIAQGFSFSAALSRVIDAMKAKVGGSAASAETVKQIADVNRLIAVQDQIVSENDNDVDRVVADNIYAMFDNPDILAAAIPSSPGGARPMSWLERRARRMFARLGERGDAIRVRLQDKALPIKRLAVERVEAETGTSVPPSLDTYLKEALYSGRAGERMIDLEQDQIEPLIEHMRNEGISLDDLGDYLYARHARERNAWIAMINDELPDGGSGMTNAEADQTLADVRASGKQAAMDEAARRIDKMIENTRKDLLKAGLIDRDTFDNWSQKYAAYVPLRGFDIGEDENPDFPRVGRGYDVRGREAFAALGRRSKADNPVIYAVQQAQQAIVRAEKNRVNKTLYNAVKSYPNESFWKIYNGELRRRLNPSTGLVEEYWVPPQFVRRDDVIGVKLNGKQKWIELKHPALARSLRGVGSDVSGSAIGRVAHKVMRTYAGLLTSYNPEFVASNFFRDVQTAIINATGLQNKPAGMRRKIAKDAVSAAAIRGALAAIRNHEGRTIFGGRRAADETILGTKRSSTAERYARYYDEFRRAGGKVSFIEFNDVERIRNKTLSALKAGRVRRGLRLAAESVEHLNTAVENGVRLSTYVTLREAGVSQDEAAFAAKELTVNFNRKGEWGPGINALYLFFNASVQGITKMARAITTSSKVRYALGGLLAFGAMLDMLNYLAAGDDDDGENRYDKIPHWVKERNLIIMNPLGDGNYLMIPLPYGYNTPFLAGQEAMSVIRGVSKPEEAAGRVLLATLEAFNPMGSAGSFLQYASPTLLDPAVQIMENRNWFGGRIMPKKFDDREPDSQVYFDSAPGWAKEVARILNEKSGGNIGRPGWADFSPETIEHWAEFAGGGTATFFFNAIATAERFVDGEEWLPEKAPMVRRLYGRQDSSVSRKREFYDAWSDVNQVHYEIKELMKSGDREAAITARDTYKPEVQAYNAMKGAQKQLKALRAARGAIETRTDLDAATKRERLDDITAKEKRVVMRSLKVYEDAKKAAGR